MADAENVKQYDFILAGGGLAGAMRRRQIGAGGLIVLGGMFLMAYNFYRTAQQHRGAPAVAAIPQPV